MNMRGAVLLFLVQGALLHGSSPGGILREREALAQALGGAAPLGVRGCRIHRATCAAEASWLWDVSDTPRSRVRQSPPPAPDHHTGPRRAVNRGNSAAQHPPPPPQQRHGACQRPCLRLRGSGSDEEDDVPDLDDSPANLQSRLDQLEELLQSGVLTQEEFEQEQQRILLESASRHHPDEPDSDSDDIDIDLDNPNITLARLTNNKMAWLQATRPDDSCDPFASAVRWTSRGGFTEDDMGLLRRANKRLLSEQEAGADNIRLDRREMWKVPAEDMIRRLMEACGPAKPLEEVSFVARRDLAVGEVVSIGLLNYTGSDAPRRIALSSSPPGKIVRGDWDESLRTMNVTVAAVIFEEEPIRIFVPCSANISIDPRSISELAHADGLLERIFSCAPFVPKGCGRTTIKDSEPPPKAPPGTVLRVEGLASNPEYNGCLAAVVGRSQNRYQVQLVATGRKILLRPRNLQMVDQNNVTSKEGAALKAWALVNDLYSSSKNASGGEVGTTAQSKALTSEDIRDLARLNISVGGETSNFWETTHCDGGLGKFVVTPPDLPEEEDEDDDEMPRSHTGKASKEPPAREKQLLLDLHLQRAAQQGDADRCAELIEAGGNISCTWFPGSMHGSFDRTPLHVAAWEQRKQVVEALLHLGADVHALDGNNATALHLAAAKGNVSVVQVLLDAGADPCRVNCWNRSSIQRACIFGHKKLTQILVDAAGPNFDSVEIEDILGFENVPRASVELYSRAD